MSGREARAPSMPLAGHQTLIRLLRPAACVVAFGCGGARTGGAAPAGDIVVGPTHDAALIAAPEPAAPAGDANTPFDLVLGRSTICVRAAGHVHCTAELGAERPVTAAPRAFGIDDAIHLAVGRDFGCAVTRAGAVMCFGDNEHGQLGAKLRAPKSDRPVVVSGVTGAKRVVAGDAHACALLGDGTVRCWGQNSAGQTGGATSYLPAARELVTAEAVERVNDVTALVANRTTTCATGRALQVTCWGHALLGYDDPFGGRSTSHRPIALPELAGLEGIAGADDAFCGIRDGAVFCWGALRSLFTGRPTGSSGLVSVNVARARRLGVTRTHACAVLLDGALSCWGSNDDGALGRGETAGSDALPAAIVKGLPAVVDVAVGGRMSCAVTGARDVYCWGTWPHSESAGRKEPTPVKVRVID